MKNVKLNTSGDTIIEVLLAMTVLTFILFTSWGLVNRATQLSLASRQRISMVNQLKEQAELLKSEYDGTGTSIAKNLGDIAPIANISSDFCGDNPSILDKSNRFYLGTEDPEGVRFELNGIKNIKEDGSSRIWIEFTKGAGYTDYLVRACWQTAGGTQKTDNSQLIVRLNN